jgi:PAS domain S-box-containing protein
MKLRTHLVTLVVAALTPVLVFSVVMVVLFWREERAAVERGMRETVRALVVAVDREIEASVIAMEALATSRALETGNLPEFYDQAVRVADSRAAWQTIALIDPRGEQRMNTLARFGSPLPGVAAQDYFRRVIETGRAAVSDLVVGPVPQTPMIATAVPVRRTGRLRYVLVAVLDVKAFDAILRKQKIPEGWLASILDRDKVVVARTRAAERFVGRRAEPDLAARSGQQDEGWFRNLTSDGDEMYTAFSRSNLTGWTIALGAPAAVVEGSLQHSLLAVAGAGALFLLLGTVLAMRVGARIAMPIVELTRSAEAVGRGEAPAPVASPVEEVTDVGRALGDAAALLQLRSAERERAAAAARESEERLRFSLEAAQIGAWDWDIATGAVTWSPTLEAIHGVAPGSFGGTFEAYREDVHPDDRERVLRALTGAVDGDQDHDLEYRILRPDGSVRWVQGRGRVFRDAAGRPVRMSGVCFDVTTRKRAEDERARLLEREQAARAEAERLNRAKDEFLATLSHELRTPLSALMGWARLLRSPNLDEATAARAIEVIERNTRVQAQLVGDLLDVSRIITGKLRLDIRPVELPRVVDAAIDAIRAAADAKQIAIATALQSTVGPLHGDADRLQQIVWNLLSNAVKFTPAGGKITVALGRDGGHVEIAVTDTGKGISADFLPYVFDRFRQADSTTTRAHGGLGLGLAIVRHLVELHGGTVHAESAGPGCGATFTVRLPLTPALPSAPAGARPDGRLDSSGPALDTLPALDGVCVLVVEDEADTREVLARVLESCGALVTAVASAAEALMTFDVATPDVLVSDIAMPVEDGYTLIGRIRARHGSAGGWVPAVALTAYARDEDRDRALEAGFQVHIPKPVEPVELARTVAALAGRLRAV